MIKYHWSIQTKKSVDTDVAKNMIVQVYWTKTGTDGEHNGSFKGTTSFTRESVDASFVPFDELTDDIIISWIKNVVTGSYEELVNARILSEIDKKRTVV